MALTPEQQKALDELFAPAPSPKVAADFGQTWFGVSTTELKRYWLTLMAEKKKVEAGFLNWVDGNPLDAAFGFLGAAAAAFYAAEKGANPRIQTYVDAFYYIATSASVGYADIFPVTQEGKAIAALVMVVGPGLTSKALDKKTGE